MLRCKKQRNKEIVTKVDNRTGHHKTYMHIIDS